MDKKGIKKIKTLHKKLVKEASKHPSRLRNALKDNFEETMDKKARIKNVKIKAKGSSSGTVKVETSTKDPKDIAHKDILQIIYDLLPGAKTKAGKQKRSNKNASDLIYKAVLDYLIRERNVIKIRNHVILESDTYQKLRERAMVEGSKIGADAVFKRFKKKSLWRRLRCAFKGYVH